MHSADPAFERCAADEQIRGKVCRYLADQVRRSLQMLPCEPDTPEAHDERDQVIIALASSLNPSSFFEMDQAAKAAVASAHQFGAIIELGVCRGDNDRTAQVRREYCSLGREGRGALNALQKLQRERRRLKPDDAATVAAADRAAFDDLTGAMETLPPLTPLPPPMPPREPAAADARAGAPPEPRLVGHALLASHLAPGPKITRPPAPLPPSMTHLADAPELEIPQGWGPHDPPGYAPWEPGCETPMWYTVHDDNLTEIQRQLRGIYDEADRLAVLKPQRVQLIRRHRGPPPDCDFPIPSDDVMHVLLNDNSANMTWADTWKPVPFTVAPPEAWMPMDTDEREWVGAETGAGAGR